MTNELNHKYHDNNNNIYFTSELSKHSKHVSLHGIKFSQPRSQIIASFCRAMLRKRGLCRHAVSVYVYVCPSVRHVREFCQNE